MLAAALVTSRDAPFELGSAGLAVTSPGPIHPFTSSCLRGRGVPVSDHAARQLSRDDVESADLVLTTERAHRTAIAELAPWAGQRTFTLSEFARLAPAVVAAGVISPWELVAAAAAIRSQVVALEPSRDDVPDPTRGGPADHEDVLSVLEQTVAGVAAALRAAGRPGVHLHPTGRRASTVP
jgi:protein-tyrosine phosphatase